MRPETEPAIDDRTGTDGPRGTERALADHAKAASAPAKPGAAWTRHPRLVLPRPGPLRRLRRKLRRWRNELTSIVAERRKSPRMDGYPVHVNLNHTTICNLRCTMCAQGLYDVPQQIMEPEVYFRIRDELFDHISEISLTVMGDPFCVPKPFMAQVLDDVERHDLRLEITTNATLLGDDEELERLARVVNKMVISFDGSTKEVFERVRVRANWERTVRNIERFRDVRRSLPFFRRPLTYFNYVLMRSNLDDLPGFIELGHQWDAYSITASPAIAVHPSMAPEILDFEGDAHVREVLQRCVDLAAGYGIVFTVPGVRLPRPTARPSLAMRAKRALSPWRPTLTQGLNYLAQKAGQRFKLAQRECGFLWQKAYLQIDGKVSTCCHHQFIVTGELSEQPFGEIWNGETYRELRATLNTDRVKSPCDTCYLLR
ncbi:radical SAM/SPASM domain-containing protein [Engelhardtia mirabilis]|uniref:Cyclic pyranopterin monophosphate synthase n=1 Tax=Engelhardtia mirabilis TaxID=2528011 RepID=A0A518BFU4_9BACT|nr:Cyclic pyranopterin monophosphate synthase [Planctomycetes bacterium Pla133]QDV00168.1 Cyclic pyranopterin monophosphate synthase [Planctomycetes bacterium Pla86]